MLKLTAAHTLRSIATLPHAISMMFAQGRDSLLNLADALEAQCGDFYIVMQTTDGRKHYIYCKSRADVIKAYNTWILLQQDAVWVKSYEGGRCTRTFAPCAA